MNNPETRPLNNSKRGNTQPQISRAHRRLKTSARPTSASDTILPNRLLSRGTSVLYDSHTPPWNQDPPLPNVDRHGGHKATVKASIVRNCFHMSNPVANTFSMRRTKKGYPDYPNTKKEHSHYTRGNKKVTAAATLRKRMFIPGGLRAHATNPPPL